LYYYFFTNPSTTEIYTLSLHDALPISRQLAAKLGYHYIDIGAMYRAITLYFIRENINVQNEAEVAEALKNIHLSFDLNERTAERDRKSTRLNSSHLVISYAVFCLKKKK